ncbi:uncharacterized protein CTHT_0046790 [Thermochaetoides thermophila DSM 1495]|uniref:Uncharacterized protein n=1 Tax=Chaetomium thermophilum (strain DSM 1495 / CBS 144.50 / IMI 039719) TaxID=759272 RepID=G0S9R0_CHATD|nr:hypothetical protein CTHT_0046790 [Thermochaetoides thermophila DSM 1495]EGS20171.1 hypothetical protein CTHT_0046790 [Thermochaetoides thermophila DSM 1495]
MDGLQLSWSSSLRVAHPARIASKDLQGDKILLPQSALEQLLAASSSSAPGMHSFTAFDSHNPYSVAGRRQFRDNDRQLPHPLMFQLINQKNGNTVYAGIREFSADEGEVALSPHLLDALGICESDIAEVSAGRTEDGARIVVRAKQLPKGEYVRLRPMEAGYDPDDWRPLLERQLRSSYTTLTKGSILTVQGAKGEEFRFLTDRFRPEGDGICVVDTDLEVDIEPLDEEQARETLRQIQAKAQKAPGTANGSSVGHAIDIWKDVDGQVLGGDYVDYELPAWDKSRPLAIELTIQDEREVDLYVSPKSNRQRSRPREDEHIFADFSSPKDGVKRIVIQPGNVELEGAESLLISIHGFVLPDSSSDPTPRRYTLRARAVDTDRPAPNGSTSAPTAPSSDEEQCRNCLQNVPKRTMLLHESFCLRNNIICPECRLVFQKSSPEWSSHWHCPTHPSASGSTPLSKAKHDYIEHTQHTCPACGPSSPFTFPSLPELSRHRTTICPHKPILCSFCHLEVPQEGDPLDPACEAETALTGLTPHERADGARTTDCHLCGAIVRLRDMAAHMAHHELDKLSRPKPIPCRVALCGRTLYGASAKGTTRVGGQGPGNDLGLCSICFAPLWANLHDPEGKALRRRIERKFLTQLMSGCGKKWCGNEYCKTGRKNLGLPPKGEKAAEAMQIVKGLMEGVYDTHREGSVWFCVDEASQKRRKIAEMLAAEGVYELEWCVAAVEAEGGSLERARGVVGGLGAY